MKPSTQTHTGRRTAAWLAAAVLALSLVTGCGKDEAAPPATDNNQQTQTPGGTGAATDPAKEGQKGDAAAEKPAQTVSLTPITYSDPDRKAIADVAKIQGLGKVYIPQQGTADEKFDQVGGGQKQVTLRFAKMSVTESATEIKPAGTVEKEQDVKLKTGTGKFVTAGGQDTLYFKVEDTFMALTSAKGLSHGELQAIADTMAPLQ
ncbi:MULTISPECIES: hypothetical protein [Paenibacillus]|uniref:hypothetical protein n=1 Tax=Paenibacillus TaxID=44249 RepID=UPI0022B90E35|nr:hypothetical protein [Paenibacillus caseinilyticus]MCZ8519136.1 hypothetical protein [Paenibacillus caseinilyticus]